MDKEFVPYEQALSLKEFGFNEPCFGYYIELRNPQEGILTIDKCENNNYGLLAPTFSQAFRWFRDKYNLRGFIGFRPNVKKFDFHIYDMSLSGMEYVKQRTMKEYNKDSLVGTYDEAELASLKKLIEIVKEKKV